MAGYKSLAQEIADVPKIHKIDVQAIDFTASLSGRGLIKQVAHIEHWKNMMDKEPGRVLNRVDLQISEVNS